jgi:hypothetical protein
MVRAPAAVVGGLPADPTEALEVEVLQVGALGAAPTEAEAPVHPVQAAAALAAVAITEIAEEVSSNRLRYSDRSAPYLKSRRSG